MQIDLKKGWEKVSFAIPGKQHAGTLLGESVPALDQQRLKEIIKKGIVAKTPADISGKKVAILVPDDTRLWARGDLYVSEIVSSLLECGVLAEDITIIIALGTHGDISSSKFAALVGEYAVKHVRVVNSANKNRDRLVSLGQTSRKTDVFFTIEAVKADHILIYGGVLHHMLAGYGGGRKYIFPGIAGYNSIQQNHSLAMQSDGSPHPMVRQLQLGDNPVNEDITEAVELFLTGKTCTYVAVAVDGRGEIFHAEVGPLQDVFANSCRKLDEVCRVMVAEKHDFALISAGGHRADGQLYQAIKGLFNSLNVVKEGGDILLVAGCSEGPGNRIFAEMLKKFKCNQNSLGKQLAEEFNMPSYVAFRVIDILCRFRVGLVSELSRSETEALGFIYVKDVQKYVNNLQGKGYVIPFSENILAAVQA